VAEVKINITAENKVTPVLHTIGKNIFSLEERLLELDAYLNKTLAVDTTGALRAVEEVKAAINAIPDISYKTVIIQYKTQASPVMPFTEGIKHIKSLMESLPTGQDYTVRFQNHRAPADTSRHQSTQNITFSPTINITSTSGKDGEALAREIDRKLAEMWRYNRSELRRAMTA
jgi:hypothetical protein